MISGCVLLFLSCRKEAKVKLPDAKSYPVMYSYISPGDTVIRLKLMKSAPLYTRNDIDVQAPVPDANVKISNTTQGTGQLIYNSISGCYELRTSAYPIVAGQVYKMTVVTSSGDEATAETEVPSITVYGNKVTVDKVLETYGVSFRIKLFFNDEPNRENYYRIAAVHGAVRISETDTIRDDTYSNELYSDKNRDGESATLSGRFFSMEDSLDYYSTEFYDVFLYNCSESYYKFQNSLNNYSGANPFTEPTLTFSNVRGGFGCFAAYNGSRFRFKRK